MKSLLLFSTRVESWDTFHRPGGEIKPVFQSDAAPRCRRGISGRLVIPGMACDNWHSEGARAEHARGSMGRNMSD